MSKRAVHEGTIVFAALKDLDAPSIGLTFPALYASCVKLIQAKKGIQVPTEYEVCP